MTDLSRSIGRRCVVDPSRVRPNDKPSTAPESAAPTSESGSAGSDVALIHGRTDDGTGLKILRAKSGHLEAGVVRPLVEGQPITGEVVRLSARKDFPLLCDVHVELDARPPAHSERTARHGPAQVATDTYRKNWDAIYSRRDDDLLN